MNNFEILKQEIQSWYPDYEFEKGELNNAVHDLIKFFAIGALSAYKAKNNRLQTPEPPIK